MELRRTANALEDTSRIQKDINSMESWVRDSRMKFSADIYKVLHLRKNNQKQ